MKWIKVDENGNPIKREKNSFFPHDYLSDNHRFLIINNSFTETKLPWVLKSGDEVLDRFKTLKAAKATAELLN